MPALLSANLMQEYAGDPYRLKDQDSNPQGVMTQMNHIEATQRDKDESDKSEPLAPANLIRFVLELSL